MIDYCFERKKLPEYVGEVIERANVYYSKGYEDIRKKHGECPVFFFDEDFLWVVFIKKQFIFKYALIPTEPVNIRGDSNGDLKKFLNAANIVMNDKLKLHWSGPVQNQAIFKEKPNICDAIPFGNYVVDLSLDEEDLWSRLHSKHRNVIRKAEKDGLTLRTGNTIEMLDEYLVIDEVTWARSNKKSNTKGAALELVQHCQENISIYIVDKLGVNQGGAIFFYNKKMSYYLYGASIDKPSAGAMNFLHWNAMLNMKEKGVKKYSFVGCRINEDQDSKYHTIQRFKERFGGELIEGYMFRCIYNRCMYMLYKLLKNIKSLNKINAPLDIIDQELWKWSENDLD